MMYDIVKKCRVLFLLFLVLFLFSCGSGFVTREMILNTSITNQSGQGVGEGDDSGEVTPEEPSPASVPVSAAFKYLLPNGEVDSTCPPVLKATLESLYANSGKQSLEYFIDNTYRVSVVETGNLTKSDFSGSGAWSLSDAAKGEYTYYKAGKQFTIYAAVETAGVDVTYYQYRSLNPFFSAYGSYNTRAFEKIDGSQETLMKRFQFYRWSGFASGQGVSNYMIAVDTYTGLVFQFAEIDEWATILGIDAPSKYAPFENYDGRRNFYEYDPIGYVAADGIIVTNEWYKDDVIKPFAESKGTTPPLTGLSPYYYEDGKTESIDATIPEQGGYPVSGTLKVQAKSLKNVNIGELTTIIPDDTAVVGGSTMYIGNPKYTYQIGFEAYSGTSKPSSTQDDASLITTLVAQNSEVEITQGNSRTFTNSSSYTFANEKPLLTLDLHSNITRGEKGGGDIRAIGGFPTSWISWLLESLYTDLVLPASSVSSLDVPTTLIYNRENLWWEDGNGFFLKDGETKDYTVSYAYGDGTMQLTYALSWNRGVSSSDTGNVIVPSMAISATTQDSQLSLESLTNSYKAKYVDKDLDSAVQEKTVDFDLTLYNLDEQIDPIIITYTYKNSNLIQNVHIGDGLINRRGGSFGKSSIPISITLGSLPWSVQEEIITFKIVYPEEGYNSEYSPQEITFTVIREHEEEG